MDKTKREQKLEDVRRDLDSNIRWLAIEITPKQQIDLILDNNFSLEHKDKMLELMMLITKDGRFSFHRIYEDGVERSWSFGLTSEDQYHWKYTWSTENDNTYLSIMEYLSNCLRDRIRFLTNLATQRDMLTESCKEKWSDSAVISFKLHKADARWVEAEWSRRNKQ